MAAVAARRPPPSRSGEPYPAGFVRSSFVVGALAYVVFCIWVAKDAGFAPTTWYAGGLFLLGLLVVLAVADPSSIRTMPTAAAVAAALLLAFAAWSGASIAWSSAKGIAWDGANRTLLYAAVYVLFASLRRHRVSAVVWLLGFGVVVAAIGVVDVARAAFGADPTRSFVFGRLDAPAGYPNAACALFVFAAWPLLHAAGRRELPPILRDASLGIVCVLGDLVVLTESRASLLVVPVAVLVYLALVPHRLRALLPLLVVAVALTLGLDRLLAPYGPLTRHEDATHPLHTVAWTIGATFVLVLAGWSIIAFVDRRLVVGRKVVVTTERIVAVVVAVAVVAGVAVLLASSPRERLSHAWHGFKSGYPPPGQSSTHFSSGLGNNRYDFWRVALDEFRRHPLNGVGVDNFAEDYVAARRSDEEPLYPHSLELRVLAQTGVVGALLFAGFIVAAAVAARGTFARSGVADGVVRAGVAAAAYVGLHGSIDWFWEFPALTAPAIAALALAAGRDSATRRHAVDGKRRLAAAGVAVGAVAVAASFVFPWIADRLQQRAAATWRRDARAAYHDLSRARALNPLSPDPDLLAGAIASKLDDVPHMRNAFRDALARDPRQWYARLELGLAETGMGRRREGLRAVRAARRLNPRDPVVQLVERRLRIGSRIDRAEIDRLFTERYRSRVGR
jgi:O-antigen ligase